MSLSNDTVAVFEDKYGDERSIHRTRHGLRVKRNHATPVLALNPVIAKMIGARIHDLRVRRGLTLEELARRCGMDSGHPKARMWAIENATRGEGMRLGTLYVVAMALGVAVCDLMPSNEAVANVAGVRDVSVPTIQIAMPS